jgi:hypothetical protein
MPANPVTVFVDANVFLSLYSYSNDDLEMLHKVKSLVGDGLIKLCEPDQVFEEISRNREVKINEAITQFDKEKLSVKLPILMRSFDEADAFSKACKTAEEQRGALVKHTLELAGERKLPADAVIEEILAVAERIEITDAIYRAAIRRNRTGNPPGKGAKIGDELNWESLLAHCALGTDLHIISNDGDYRCPLDKSGPRKFLISEWREKKWGELHLHAELGPFLRSIDDSIRLVTETAKNAAVMNLVNSGSFASTHVAIAELKPYMALLTPSDVETLLRAALDNSQIKWIAGDEDVREFFETIWTKHGDNVDPELAKIVEAVASTAPAAPGR